MGLLDSVRILVRLMSSTDPMRSAVSPTKRTATMMKGLHDSGHRRA
jgi:hypothetical protein